MPKRRFKTIKKSVLKTAVGAALAAGRLLMNSYGKLMRSQISLKSKNDFVTEVDRQSERRIIAMIRKNFPADAIQAEESGISSGGERLWIIDPLDGTANYIRQFPMFAVSIGVAEAGRLAAGGTPADALVAGVVYDPLHRELFTARRGKGAFLNKKRIRVAAVRSLSDAMMTTGIPFRARNRYDEYIASLKKISLASAGMRRGGSAALDLAYVACGRLDGFWEINLSPWDIAAGALLIQEAGGKVSDVWGSHRYLENGDVLASNGRIHAELEAITSAIFSKDSA